MIFDRTPRRDGRSSKVEAAKMRILIGYNGSDAAKAAIQDLRYAGFPDDTEAVVLTVAEFWLEPKTDK